MVIHHLSFHQLPVMAKNATLDPPAPGGQSLGVVIQDSVDPPNQITLHYWIGCKASSAIGCSDYNFDGLPNEDEYELKTLSSPEIQAGGLNIFQGLIDDSMLTHGQALSYYVTGKDAQNNAVAMGVDLCAQTQASLAVTPLAKHNLIGTMIWELTKFVSNSNRNWIWIILPF